MIFVRQENFLKEEITNMKKTFIIDQSIALQVGNAYYDLHNMYDFMALHIKPKESLVVMKFKKILHVSMDKPHQIQLSFNDVDFFEISSKIMQVKTMNLSEIGYKYPEDNDLDWLLNEDENSIVNHMIFRFEGDEYIRIHSKKVNLDFIG